MTPQTMQAEMLVSWLDRAERMAESASTSIISTIIAAVVGAVTWLIRRVLTNHRQIELLQLEIKHRDKQRDEDRESLKAVRDDVKDIRRAIMGPGK